MIKENKAYLYAKKWRAKEMTKYVKKTCKEFVKIAENKDEKYCINEKRVEQIENILKLLRGRLKIKNYL